MSHELDSAFRELQRSCEVAKRLLSDAPEVAEVYAAKSSELLFGLSTGLLGMLLAVFSQPFHDASVFAVTTIGTGLGAGIGIIVYRGRKQIALERMLRLNRTLEEELRRRIEALPDSAPEYVREQLWQDYSRLAAGAAVASEEYTGSRVIKKLAQGHAVSDGSKELLP